MRVYSRSFSARQTGIGVACLVLTLAGCSGRGAEAGGSAAAGEPTTGITAEEVVVGNISSLSGPVPGLFQGSPNGVEAYFAKVNAEGGVHGRQLRLIGADDALNCNQNTSATKEMVGQVAAFVNNYSVFDGCGAMILAEHPDVANVSPGVDDRVGELSTHVSPSPTPHGSRLGGFLYYQDTFGVETVGTLYQAGAAEMAWHEQKAAMESIGYTIGYERALTPTESNFTADIVRMRDAGVDFLYLNAMPVNNVVQVLQQARQQDWRPTLITSGVAYDSKFFDLLGDPAAAEGLHFDHPFALFLGEDGDSNPAVADFLEWMEKVHPEFRPDLFAMYGWVAAQLLVEGLEAAGENPTRQGLLDALQGIGSFDAGGMLAEVNVGEDEPAECMVVGRVEDGAYVRVLPEGEGFVCEPSGYFRIDG